jgi:hypothetical protein
MQNDVEAIADVGRVQELPPEGINIGVRQLQPVAADSNGLGLIGSSRRPCIHKSPCPRAVRRGHLLNPTARLAVVPTASIIGARLAIRHCLRGHDARPQISRGHNRSSSVP